jgi:hypothetical protein
MQKGKVGVRTASSEEAHKLLKNLIANAKADPQELESEFGLRNFLTFGFHTLPADVVIEIAELILKRHKEQTIDVVRGN